MRGETGGTNRKASEQEREERDGQSWEIVLYMCGINGEMHIEEREREREGVESGWEEERERERKEGREQERESELLVQQVH